MAELKITVSPDEVKDAICLYLRETYGFEANPTSISFDVANGYSGDVRDPGYPPALKGAVVKNVVRREPKASALHFPPGVRGGCGSKGG